MAHLTLSEAARRHAAATGRSCSEALRQMRTALLALAPTLARLGAGQPAQAHLPRSKASARLRACFRTKLGA